jgi:integrase
LPRAPRPISNAHKAGWKSAKHADQWTATLTTYAGPVFGELPVSGVDDALVLKVLQPIWSTKAETAGRVRGRIEAILDYARVLGLRAGENPARWKGHLEIMLPARGKVARVEHHAALPYAELPAFMIDLRQQNGIAARALEFAILTAARTTETIGARWTEIDFEARHPETRAGAAQGEDEACRWGPRGGFRREVIRRRHRREDWPRRASYP